MSPLEAALRLIATDLLALRTPHAVIGGLAVSARAEARFTRDVDLAVAVADDEEAEVVVRELMARGHDDLTLARAAVHLITERGFDRGRDLPALFDAWLAGEDLDAPPAPSRSCAKRVRARRTARRKVAMTDTHATPRTHQLSTRRAAAVALCLSLAAGSTAYLSSRADAAVTSGTLAYGLIPATAGVPAPLPGSMNQINTFRIGGTTASDPAIDVTGLDAGTVLLGIDVRPARTGGTGTPSASPSASASASASRSATASATATATVSATPSPSPAAGGLPGIPGVTLPPPPLPLTGNLVVPRAGTLYAVGRVPATQLPPAPATAALYTINPLTGAATKVGTPITPVPEGANFAMDFNPVADRLRLMSDTDQNLRINPDTGGAATVDGNLAFAAGDSNMGDDAVVGATAYTNSVGPTAPTATMQYAIDATNDALVLQNSNAGTLQTVGTLGTAAAPIDVTAVAGMDISPDGNRAFAVLRTAGAPMPAASVYEINLTTGRATLSRALDNGAVTDMAFVSTAAFDTTDPSVSASASASASATPSGGAATPTVGTVVGGRFTAVTPARVFDSRSTGAGGPIAGGTDRIVQITGANGVPMTGVTAVVANVTVTGGSAPGDLQVYPSGNKPATRTSNLNYKKGQTVAVAVEVGVSSAGQISVSANSGTVQVIVDVFGYYGAAASTTGAGYTAQTPVRILDTRATGGGGKILATSNREVQLAGANGVPADATAVVVNATVLDAPANLDVQFFPTGNAPMNRTSNLNVVKGQVVANAVTTPVGTGGRVTISVGQGSANVILDVLGYYSPSSTARFTPVQPARILDTRTNKNPVVAMADRAQAIRGQGNVPPTATAAVLSVTATGAKGGTDLQVFPTGARPAMRTSSLNLRPGQAVANLVVATIGTDGSITLSNNNTSVDVIVDVLGYLQ